MFIKNSLLPVKGKTRLSIGFCLVLFLFLSLTSFTFPVGSSGSHLSLRFNNVPVFSSSGTAVFYENGTGTVLDINANDGDGGADDVSVTYSISGEDADAFSIDTDGNLTFKVVPDHDTPSDADQDNFYHLTVTADDGELTDNTASQQVTVILIPEVEEGYNLSNEVQLGNSIFGEADGDESGESIAINGDGSIMAIGSIENTGSGAGAGHVRVFSFQDGTLDSNASQEPSLNSLQPSLEPALQPSPQSSPVAPRRSVAFQDPSPESSLTRPQADENAHPGILRSNKQGSTRSQIR